MQKLWLSLFFLLLILATVNAARIDGWRGSHLDSRTSGFSLTTPEYVSDVDIRVNGRLVDATDWDEFLIFENESYKFAPKVRVQRTVLNSRNIKNATMSFTFTKPYEEIGSGILRFKHSYSCLNEFSIAATCYYYDYWTFADLFNATAWHGLSVNVSQSPTTYNLTLWGFNSSVRLHREQGGRGWLELDPLISYDRKSLFSAGLFNASYTNGSNHVYSLYFPNNFTFANKTTYLSQVIAVNTSYSNFTQVNWTWAEVLSFGNLSYVDEPGTQVSYTVVNWTNQSGDDAAIGYCDGLATYTRYPTGTTNSIGKATGAVACESVGSESWFNDVYTWNISAIPTNAVVQEVNVSFYVNAATSNTRCGVNHMDFLMRNVANTSGGNQVLFTDANNGSSYNYSVWCNTTGLKNLTLSSAAVSALQTALSSQLFSVGVNSSEDGAGFTVGTIAAGENAGADLRPRLTVRFTVGAGDLVVTEYSQPLWHLGFEQSYKDYSKYNNSAGPNGTATANPTFVNTTCFIGSCLYFDGNDGLFILRQAKNNLTNGITASAYVNIQRNSSNNMFIEDRLGYGTFQGWGLYVNSFNNTHLMLHFPIGNGSAIVDNALSNVNCLLIPNRTYYLSATWNSTSNNVTYYINGTQCGNPSFSTKGKISNLIDYNRLGFRFTEGFFGTIDELQLWNRSLTAVEVNQSFQWLKSVSENQKTGLNNFSNLSIQTRGKNYSFDATNLTLWIDGGDSSENESAYLQTLDLSGFNNKGNLTSNGGYPIVTNNGVIGKALNLSEGGYIEFGAPTAIDYGQNFTLSAWVNLERYNNASAEYVITKRRSTDFTGYSMEITNGYPSFSIGTIPIKTVNATVRLPLTNWSLITATQNTTNLMIYVNGVLSNITSSSKISTNSRTFRIGVQSIIGVAQGFNGSIDDVKGWNRTLSSQEVYDLYGNGTPSIGVESNWTAFSPEYYGGVRSFGTYYTKLIQYRLNLYQSNAVYSPFVTNVSFFYTPVPIDYEPPKWSNNRTTSTTAGYPSTLIVNWTDDTSLNNYTFEIDNGAGFVNYSIVNFSGIFNTSNRTILVNGTAGLLIRWRVYAWDSQGRSNATDIFEFTTTNPAINNYCNLYGGYLANQSGEYVTYAANASLTCTFTLKNATGYAFYNFTTMTNLSRGFYNVSLNLSRAGLYNATVNCSNGTETNPLFYENRQVQVRDTCSAPAVCLYLEAQAFKKGQAFNNNMQFVVTFGVIALVLFAVYYWLHKRDENKKEDETKDTRKIVDYYLNLMNKYLALILGVTSLAFMFYFSWLGYSGQVIESQNFTYANFTAEIAGQSARLPVITSVSTSSTQPLDAGSTTMAEAAVRVFLTLIGVYAMLLIIAQVLKFLASMQDQYNKRQIGESDDEQ